MNSRKYWNAYCACRNESRKCFYYFLQALCEGEPRGMASWKRWTNEALEAQDFIEKQHGRSLQAEERRRYRRLSERQAS